MTTRLDEKTLGIPSPIPSSKRCRGPIVAAALFMLAVSGAFAQETDSARRWIAKGAEAYQAGDFAAAVEAYTKAREIIPDQSEVAYNLGAAHYQLGDLDKARELFTESLRHADRQLEGRAKFNLGNVAYAEALKKLAESENASNLLKRARSHYRDAIEVDPTDEDARANIELAQQLLQQLLQQQQQQQPSDQKQDEEENEEQRDQQQDRQQPQPQSQPSSQPSADRPPPQDRDDSEEQPNPEQPQSPEQDGKQGDPQQTPSEEPDPKERESTQQQSAEESEKRDEANAQPSPDQLSREEAERLLQSVRDRERQRREELAKHRQANRSKVTKDW